MRRTVRIVIVALASFLLAQAARADWTSVRRLTWTSGASHYPAVAVDSSNGIHVVWRDETPGNVEIYYRKGK